MRGAPLRSLLFCVAAMPALALAWGLRAGDSIEFEGNDLGCESYQVQVQRLAALTARDGTTFTELSRRFCKRLTGEFRIVEVKPIKGGRVLRVHFGDGFLWVLHE